MGESAGLDTGSLTVTAVIQQNQMATVGGPMGWLFSELYKLNIVD